MQLKRGRLFSGMSCCSVPLEWDPCMLHMVALCLRGMAHARRCVYSLWPGRGASASSTTGKPAVPVATFLSSCLFWSSGRRTVSEPRVICGSAAHVNVHVSASGGKVVFFYFFLFVHGNGCGLCPSQSYPNIIFIDGVTFYLLLLTGISNVGSCLANRGWHREKKAVTLKVEICVFK